MGVGPGTQGCATFVLHSAAPWVTITPLLRSFCFMRTGHHRACSVEPMILHYAPPASKHVPAETVMFHRQPQALARTHRTATSSGNSCSLAVQTPDPGEGDVDYITDIAMRQGTNETGDGGYLSLLLSGPAARMKRITQTCPRGDLFRPFFIAKRAAPLNTGS